MQYTIRDSNQFRYRIVLITVAMIRKMMINMAKKQSTVMNMMTPISIIRMINTAEEINYLIRRVKTLIMIIKFCSLCIRTNRTDSEEESFNSNVVDSSGVKTKLWKPIVPKDFMSDVDAIYQSLEEAVEMYKLYADKAGFGVRSTDTLDPEGSGRNKRNSNFKITDFKSLIKFERLHMQTNSCKIYEFQENHNHPLETKEERRYSKCARRLSYKDKEFIVRSSTSNIGATKAHKLQASLKGGYENVGPEAIDYKNFRRKMGNIIGDKDAQLVVDKMNMRKDELHNYTFEYKCVNSVLNTMFWADETDKLYYKEFGDVITFDATFRTNNVEKIDGWQVVMITQTDKSKQLKIKCKVELKLPEKEVKCSCNHFIRTGILCRHICVVLKNNHVEEIPEQYILRRWRRDAISSHLLTMKHVAMETEDDTFKLLTEAYNNIEYCLDHFKRSNEKLLEFVEKTRTLKQAAMEFGSSNQTSPDNDEEEIIRMLGIRGIPDEINIHPPASIRTKGSGIKKRMVSAIEKAVAAAKEKTRMCTGCNQYVNHNWRSCKVRLARKSKAN
ncbi:unnamed protein product [Lactuca saligna]|uniref:SWIM-type domain-containing protein n=1 Tax=Lactuca saligna TaxID=75948 RepID=A0AA35ZRH5_LACSI|nr:unnamed protein product [Lactuca saligna]